MKPKPPAAKEITIARNQVIEMEVMTQRQVMNHWKGECWHKDEILLGIFIGLQIAENCQQEESTK